MLPIPIAAVGKAATGSRQPASCHLALPCPALLTPCLHSVFSSPPLFSLGHLPHFYLVPALLTNCPFPLPLPIAAYLTWWLWLWLQLMAQNTWWRQLWL